MKRKVSKTKVSSFEALLRADMVIFAAINELTALGLTECIEPLDQARKCVVKRLEKLQPSAYARYERVWPSSDR